MLKGYYVTVPKVVKNRVLKNAKRFCDVCGEEITSSYYKAYVEQCNPWDDHEIDCCSKNCANVFFNKHDDPSRFRRRSLVKRIALFERDDQVDEELETSVDYNEMRKVLIDGITASSDILRDFQDQLVKLNENIISEGDNHGDC